MACSTDGDGGDADAADDGGNGGTVTIYTGRNEERLSDLFSQFEEESGITVEVRYGDSAEMAAQILEEGDASNADIFFSLEAGGLNALNEAGQLTEIPADVLDNVPPEFRADDGSWVGTSARARVVAYNPDNVAEDDLPDSIEDLLDEQWHNDIGYSPTNSSWQAFVGGLRAIEGDAEAQRLLTEFRDLEPEAFENNRAIVEAVENGDVSFGLTNHYYRITQAEEDGEENVSWEPHYVTDDPLGIVNLAGAGVLEGSDNQESAFEVVDFLVSDTAQEFFANETAEYPVREGVESTEHDLQPLSELGAPDIDLTSLDSTEETLEMLRAVGLL